MALNNIIPIGMGQKEKEPLPFHQNVVDLLGDDIATNDATVTIGIIGGSDDEILFKGPMTNFVNLLSVVRTFIKDDENEDAQHCEYFIKQLAHKKMDFFNSTVVPIIPDAFVSLTMVLVKQRLMVKSYDLSNPVEEYYSHFTDILNEWFDKYENIHNKVRIRVEITQCA